MSIKNKLLIVLFLGIAFFGLSMVLGSTKKVNAQSYSLSVSVPTEACSSTNKTRFEFSWSGPTAPGTMQLRIWEDQFAGVPDAEPLVTSHSISVADSDSGSWTWTSTKSNFQFRAYIYFFGFVSNGVSVVPDWGTQCRPDLEIRNGSGGTSPAITGPTSVNVGESATYIARTRNDDSYAYVLNDSTTRASTTSSTNNSQDYSVGSLNPKTNSGQHSFTTSWNTAGTYTVTFEADVGNTVVEDSNSNNDESIVVNVRDFTIDVAPASISIAPGDQAVYIVTLKSLNNFTGTINLSETLSVSGITESFSPTSVTLSAGGTATSTLTVSTTITTVANTYPFNVTGSFNYGSEVLSHMKTVTLIVGTSAGQPDLVPTALSAGAGIVGSPMNFQANIRNTGSSTTSIGFTNRLRIDLNDDGGFDITLPDQSSNVIAAGVTETPARTWVWPSAQVPVAPATRHRFEVCADTSDIVANNNQISESNASGTGESNNCVSQTFTVSDYDSWLKTERGDVGSEGDIKLENTPAGQTSAEYLVLTTDINVPQPSDLLLSAARNWLVTSYNPNITSNSNFEELLGSFGNKATEISIGVTNKMPTSVGVNNVYLFNGNVTWKDGFENGGSCGSSSQRSVLVFVKGTLTIQNNPVNPNPNPCPTVIVVKEAIIVDPSVTQIGTSNNAGVVLISDGVFSSGAGTSLLNVYGAVYSSLAGGAPPNFDRQVGSGSPSEHIILDPRVFWSMAKELGVSKTTYQEINP